MNPCPCGLFYEDVRDDCMLNAKRCPNFYADDTLNEDGTPKICDRLLGAHPHTLPGIHILL
jgi:ferredoxin-thioredoxin reductase catalytic subunit